MRLFFALDIKSQDKQNIAAWQRFIEKELNNNSKTPFNNIPANNFHITLSFLGTIPEQQYQALINFADNILCQKYLDKIIPQGNTELNFSEIGLFKQPKVLYLALSQTPIWLATLAKAFKEEAKSLSIYQEERPYLPHLSLFRKATVLPTIPALNHSVVIESISLYQSISHDDGVIYQPIQTWPLQ